MELSIQPHICSKYLKKKIWKEYGEKVQELRKLRILSIEDKEMHHLVTFVERILEIWLYKSILKLVMVDPH